MTPTIPFFGTPAWGRSILQPSALPDTTQLQHDILRKFSVNANALYAWTTQLVFSNCPYNQIPAQTARLNTRDPLLLLESLTKELTNSIGAEVDSRIAKRLEEQQANITTQITSAKDAMLAKKTNSIISLNGSASFISVGKFTEAWTKSIEVLQAVGKAWSGATNAASNVDSVSFPRQLGRSMLNGAKGAMKFTAGGLGAAVVMAALLATSGIALNKVHDAYPSAPSATSIMAGITSQVEKLKVTVGSVEIEKAGGAEVKTLSMQERAAGLLAQNGNDYGKTIASVNLALSLSLIDGKTEAVESQTKLLEQLQRMQTSQLPVVSSGATAPTSAAGLTM